MAFDSFSKVFPEYKNSILQRKGILEPRLLNRSVDLAFYKKSIDSHDHEPPFFRLFSEQPCHTFQNIDIVRREQAFGDWALPKLLKEIYRKDPMVALQALSTICDIFHDPERVYEAIRLKFVPRLGNLLLNSDHISFQERCLIALTTIVSHAVGREEVLNRLGMLNNLKKYLFSVHPDLRCKMAAFLEMLSRSFTATCVLVEEEFIKALQNTITVQEKQVVRYHLMTLEKLFFHPRGQEDGIHWRYINKLVFLLNHEDSEIISLAGNALSMLISHPKGKIISVDMELIEELHLLLYHPNRDVYTSAAEVLMFATHTVEAKRQAALIPGLTQRLVLLANDFKNPATQMFCIKALGNMVEHPIVRQQILRNFMTEVNEINVCNSSVVKNHKENLLKLINWKPWIG